MNDNEKYMTLEDVEKMKNFRYVPKNFITFIPDLACLIGLNESIFLGKLDQMLKDPESESFNIDNCNWFQSSYSEWKQNVFPFWSEKTIERVVKSLKIKNLIHTSDKYKEYKMDSRLSYTINYSKLGGSENE